MNQLIVYGVGNYGKKLYRFLQRQNITVDYFCQTSLGEKTEYDGVPIIDYSLLPNIIVNGAVIAISISNKAVARQIKLLLTNTFINKMITVLECGSFIQENLVNLASRNTSSGDGYCLLCNNTFSKFNVGGLRQTENLPLFKNHHVVGGGWRDTCKCPVCNSTDRERWFFYVLSKFTDIFTAKCRVLHFAPETHVSELIASNDRCDYYTGDVVRGRAMHYTDILDIQYKDNVFDYVIMNHVLEHIVDINRAMAETQRVLKPSGKLIISFPICTDQPTFEDASVDTDEKRLEFYGQSDHVRLFGNDYKDRIESFNWIVNVYSPGKLLAEADVKRYGFIPDDVLMICEK